jgi:hypothetical protein
MYKLGLGPLIENRKRKAGAPTELVPGITQLKELGLGDKAFYKLFFESYGRLPYSVDCCKAVAQYCEEHDLDPEEIPIPMEWLLLPPGVYGWRPKEEASATLKAWIEMFDNYQDVFLRSSLIASQQSGQSEIGMKTKIEKLSHMDLQQFPEMAGRLEKLGIPGDLASQMFASWGTYCDYTRSLSKPDELLSLEALDGAAYKQARFVESQFRAVESMVNQHGIEDVLGIINVFGIHSFGRYDSVGLKRQLDDWKSGEPIGKVVVESHADYDGALNSGRPGIEDGAQESPICFFEAGSVEDLERVMVRIGLHAEQYNYEPKVKPFLVIENIDRFGDLHMLVKANGNGLNQGSPSFDTETSARVDAYLGRLGEHANIIAMYYCDNYVTAPKTEKASYVYTVDRNGVRAVMSSGRDGWGLDPGRIVISAEGGLKTVGVKDKL